jgi:hypothetical protein
VRTVAGCCWLLDRWAELRARLETGEVWTAPDQFKAIRLLGKQPLDAIDDPDVTLICLASAKLLPAGKGADAFATIKNELRDCRLGNFEDEYSTYSKELSKRSFANLQPHDAGAAREALRALIDRQTARLKLIEARNQEAALADAAGAADRLAFDPSLEGDKLRRYQLSAARLANQTIRTFLSVVRGELSAGTENNGAQLGTVGGDIAKCEWDNRNPFAERKATMSEAAEAGAARVQREATISLGEASLHELQTEPNVHLPMSRSNPPALQAGENDSYDRGTQGFSLGCTPPALQAEDSYPPACKADGFQPRVQPWEFEQIPHHLSGTPCSRPEGPEGPVLDVGQQPARHQNPRSSRMPPAFSNPEPLRHTGPDPLRTEANADSSVVRCPLSVAREEKPEGPERGAVELLEGAATSAHERPGRILRSEPNADSSVVSGPWSVDADENQNKAERGAVPGRSHSPNSFDRHPPPGSTPAPITTVAEGSGAHDVRNRRYFGAQMSAARAGGTGSQRTSRPKPRRSGSRKPAKTRKRD